jgi:hypothetical protein
MDTMDTVTTARVARGFQPSVASVVFVAVSLHV